MKIRLLSANNLNLAYVILRSAVCGEIFAIFLLVIVMTTTDLIFTLVENIKTVVKDYKLLAENQPDKKVSVYAFDLPYGNFEGDTFAPYILITPKIIDLVERDSIVTVSMLIATYAGEPGNDWRDLLSIAERIRQFILTTPIVSEKFLWNHVFHFEPVTPEQPTPFILGYVEADYRIATPESVTPFFKVRDY